MEEVPELISKITPHRLTKEGMVRMAVRQEVDPLSGRLTGRRFVDPLIIAALERQGYDPEPYVRALLEAANED
jgi:hypothetical protein